MMYLRLLIVFLIGLIPLSALAENVLVARAVRSGAVISASDVEMGTTQYSAGLTSLSDVIGMQATRNLFPGRPILAEDLREPHVIERNQRVTITFFYRGLSIVTDGRALDGGAVGDSIRVLNADSRKTVVGTVLVDGTVSVTGAGF